MASRERQLGDRQYSRAAAACEGRGSRGSRECLGRRRIVLQDAPDSPGSRRTHRDTMRASRCRTVQQIPRRAQGPQSRPHVIETAARCTARCYLATQAAGARHRARLCESREGEVQMAGDRDERAEEGQQSCDLLRRDIEQPALLPSDGVRCCLLAHSRAAHAFVSGPEQCITQERRAHSAARPRRGPGVVQRAEPAPATPAAAAQRPAVLSSNFD